MCPIVGVAVGDRTGQAYGQARGRWICDLDEQERLGATSMAGQTEYERSVFQIVALHFSLALAQ